MKIKTNLKIKSNIIEPVPFINVILVLIMFFVLSTHFLAGEGIVFDLPLVEQGELYKITDSRGIMLKDEKILLDNKEVDIDKLKTELLKAVPELVSIKGDKSISYSKITEIIELAKSIGIKQIAIATQSEK